jgi:hypothetical protein
MMLFEDVSTHRWIGALGQDINLVVTLEDATGKICSELFGAEEGTIRLK